MKAPADEPPTTPPRAFAIFASIRTAGQLNELGEHFGALLATTGHHHRTRARSDRRRAIPGGGSRATADLTSCCAAGPGIAGDDQREQHDRRRLRETQDERWSGHRRRREKGERRGGASNCSVRSEGQPCCAITPSCLQAYTPARLHACTPSHPRCPWMGRHGPFDPTLEERASEPARRLWLLPRPRHGRPAFR